MLQQDRLDYYFSLPHELPEVEFKGPGKRGDNPLCGRVIRAAIAMANRRNGGTIIIGVADLNGSMRLDGLTSEQLATWKYEDIAGGFNSHTSTPIEFERQEYEQDGRTFLILHIHEFVSVPVMCIKEYRDNSNSNIPPKDREIILRKGAFYVRTLNKPESMEMLSSEEIRTMFDLANDKAIYSFVTRTKLAGINIAPSPTDNELFVQQLKDWTGSLLDEIRTRGYWDIRIHPVTFVQARVPLLDLRALLVRASLNYRGWEFPYITPVLPRTGNDWISLDNQYQNILQAWQFFQSGQFVAATGYLEDWSEKLNYRSSVPSPGTVLSINDVVFRLTEIFGLASRLATTDIYRDEQSMTIDVTLRNVQNRQLYGQQTYLPLLLGGHTTAASSISYPTVAFAKDDLIAHWQELARKAAFYIFERFAWQPSDALLTTIQAQLSIHL